jgi:hypothetical protein
LDGTVFFPGKNKNRYRIFPAEFFLAKKIPGQNFPSRINVWVKQSENMLRDCKGTQLLVWQLAMDGIQDPHVVRFFLSIGGSPKTESVEVIGALSWP